MSENNVHINLNCKMAARFKFVKRKRDASGKEVIVNKPEWTSNIMLDQGLNFLSTKNYTNILGYISVGSGNSTPTETQTTLQTKIAHTSGSSPTQPSTGTINLSTAPFYLAARRSFRFTEGQAVGILSEVGLSWNGTELSNRALIRDNNGNLTTITVLADEILDIIVEMRIYIPSTLSGSFPLKDKVGNTIRTVNYTGKPFVPVGANSFGLVLSQLRLEASYSAMKLFSTPMAAGYVTLPTGSFATNNGSGSTESNTYPTSRSLTYVGKMGASVGNFDHKTMVCTISGLFALIPMFGFQMEFDTPITKTASDTLTYTLGLTWDRYVA